MLGEWTHLKPRRVRRPAKIDACSIGTDAPDQRGRIMPTRANRPVRHVQITSDMRRGTPPSCASPQQVLDVADCSKDPAARVAAYAAGLYVTLFTASSEIAHVGSSSTFTLSRSTVLSLASFDQWDFGPANGL